MQSWGAPTRLRLGSLVSIGPFCFFAPKAFIDVGSDVSIGSATQVLAGGHAHDDPDTPAIRQARITRTSPSPTVWIRTGVTILEGITIGRGSILSGWTHEVGKPCVRPDCEGPLRTMWYEHHSPLRQSNGCTVGFDA